MIQRLVPLAQRPAHSFFLWGPRQTGKSTLLRSRYADAHWIDLLDTDALIRFTDRVSVAISGQVHDGRGAERRRGYGTGAARRSCLRFGGPRRWQGRECQEPQEVAEPLRFPGHLR